jgi:5-methylthioadenosine/S-adenosylhomocysteine deaminase
MGGSGPPGRPSEAESLPIALFRGADVLTVDAADRVLPGGWVAVEEGRIAALGAAGTEPAAGGVDEVHDLAGCLLLPGLVNAHAHSPMVLFRGRAEAHSLLTIDGWFRTIREPELSMEPDDVGPAAALAYAEMAATGTTTVADQYFFADEVLAAAHASGLRGAVAYGIVELGDAARGDRELAAAEAFVVRAAAVGGRVAGWIGPHAPFVDNSADLLRREADVARRHAVGLHLHMAIGPEDNEQTLAESGVTAAGALDRLGFFRERVLAAHCLDLSEEDIAVFAAAPAAAVAQCATAGLRSGRPGIAPVVALREAGATVALGTDNMAANNSHDLIAEMKVAGLAAAHREGRAGALPAAALLRMASIDGARALGLDDRVGSLEPGKEADLVVVDARRLGYSPTPDPAALLVYSGSGRDVRHVLVAGESIVRDGALTRLDPTCLRRDFGDAYRRFWRRVDDRRVA